MWYYCREPLGREGGGVAAQGRGSAGVSGSAGKYINLWAYPGESPVLDFSGEPYAGNGSPRGIELKKNYIKNMTFSMKN